MNQRCEQLAEELEARDELINMERKHFEGQRTMGEDAVLSVESHICLQPMSW